ncbi:MAG: exodeoxyribonuclease VII small subunit [Bifidobacteriaceae bacterium]|nr:exodeoxyribonuclease VII small subunit [Bifidobacteriaceae bacterium]
MAADSKDTTADKDANGALPKVTLRGMTDEDRATIDSLDYEGTRNQLATIVEKLQHGGLTLEESMRYWQIGEALADRAQAYLEEVRKQLEQARRVQQSGEEHAGTQL